LTDLDLDLSAKILDTVEKLDALSFSATGFCANRKSLSH
jgi:hypothetical protein